MKEAAFTQTHTLPKRVRMSDAGGNYARREGRWPANAQGVTEMEQSLAHVVREAGSRSRSLLPPQSVRTATGVEK